ncbi:MAG TPA: 16S rRNA (adenine(1518)-N(6)/adenine(1519)-N(6))-dimethyltransferase [Eubacterium sp.]|nr:16S rRNA (adenine(1518)-N(6)/adenine(1519)-N(6))-dimethyltransferase [Eubacterium sp.]
MNDLASTARIRAIMAKYDFAFQKKFGQNFLIDPSVVESIVDKSLVGPEDTVLEIGPGIGVMTSLLSMRAKKVITVEIDKKLIPILKDNLSDRDNVEIINKDILEVDLDSLCEEKLKVVANLPYYITTPIIMKLLESDKVDMITVMVQKEVAERMAHDPGSKEYGALSLAVQYYAEPKIVLEVGSESFMPRPNVDSSVIRLERYAKPPVEMKDKALCFAIIKAAFGQRRKTMTNAVGHANLGLSKDDVADILTKMGLDVRVRGEVLSLAEYATFADLAYDRIHT